MQIDDTQLVKLVQKNRCLYDPKHSKYKTTAYRDQTWANIASKLSFDDTLTPQDCKMRWTHLRHLFRKYLNRLKNPNSNTWPLAKNMLFLVPHLDNLGHPEIIEEFVQKHRDDDINNDTDSVTFDSSNKFVLLDPRTNSDVNESEWRTRNNLSMEPEAMVQTTKIDPIERPKSTVQLNNYFNLIRDTIESFSPVQQIDVRRKIYEVIYEAEMQNALSGNFPNSNSLSFNNTC